MPSGVNNFIAARVQNSVSSSKDLEKRQKIAMNAKIQPASLMRPIAPIQGGPLYKHTQNRGVTTGANSYGQPHNGHVPQDDTIFGGSELEEDSDDTTKGFPGITSAGDGRLNYAQEVKQFQDEADYDEENDEAAEEEEHDDDRLPTQDAVIIGIMHRDGAYNESEQLHGRRVPLDTFAGNLDAETLRQHFHEFQQDPGYLKAERAYERGSTSNNACQTPLGKSGRFIGSNNYHNRTNFAASAHEIAWEKKGIQTGYHRETYQDNNERPISKLTSSDGIVTEPQYVTGREIEGRREGFKHISQTDDLEAQKEKGHVGAEEMFAGSELQSLSDHSSPSVRTPRAHTENTRKTMDTMSASIKRAAIELDYEESTLLGMKYEELKDQPFDNNPQKASSVIPYELTRPEATLDKCLQHFAARELDEQARFFAQMPMEQWERSGDWFLGCFADLLSKLKDARQEKRNISRAFEDELAVQEEIVRSKSDGIQEVMRQMKAGGEGVLQGRTL